LEIVQALLHESAWDKDLEAWGEGQAQHMYLETFVPRLKELSMFCDSTSHLSHFFANSITFAEK